MLRPSVLKRSGERLGVQLGLVWEGEGASPCRPAATAFTHEGRSRGCCLRTGWDWAAATSALPCWELELLWASVSPLGRQGL